MINLWIRKREIRWQPRIAEIGKNFIFKSWRKKREI